MTETISKPEYETVKALWDNLLEILFERVKEKTLTLPEVRHLKQELTMLLLASKGNKSAWNSVIDVTLALLQGDISVGVLKRSLKYNGSTIYRALARLEGIGFADIATATDGSGKAWTINKERFPVLHRATRSA